MLYFWVIVGCAALVAGIPVDHQENQNGAEFRLSESHVSEVESSRDSQRVARVEPRDSRRVARAAQLVPGRAAELTQLRQSASEGRQQVQEDERAVSADISRILRIAGTNPVAVDPSGSYSGRKRRSDSSLDLTDAAGTADSQLSEQLGQEEGGRNFGDIARILQIAGTKPKPVDLTGSYSGRRKRESLVDLGQQPSGLEDVEDVQEVGHQVDRYQDSFLFGRETERRKRSNQVPDLHGLVPNVAIQAVKVKSHGKYGNVAQAAVDGATSSRSVFEAVHYGRRRRSNVGFIPFSEYDTRRVKTLKIEQNDFLALPQRLHLEKTEAERRKRKFQLS